MFFSRTTRSSGNPTNASQSTWSFATWWIVAISPCLSLALISESITAQDPAPKKYKQEFVAKAEKILSAAGLRQSGKNIQATETSRITRAISGLTREKRELRLVQKEWKQVADQVTRIRIELQRLNNQYGELNLQLARVAGVDVGANNRIVGLLNATTAKMKALTAERERLKEELLKRRVKLNDAETAYAETVLAIREEFSATRDKLAQSLKNDDVQIALQVMRANHQTPEEVTADQVLLALDKRIERIEQEIFSEEIPLIVEQRSMYVNVVVGRKSTRMVVDSGATMICLPQKTALELGIRVPPDAREMKLVLADGSEIPARGVTLPRVRVGEFEAENVEAAVLDATADQAEPLLGMSFLGNFKFELDPAEKTLKLLRVKAD